MNFRLQVAELDGVSAMKRAAVKEAFDRLFTKEDRCATKGCDRRPLGQSKFCGACIEDRREGQSVIFRGGELLPVADEMARLAFNNGNGHQWHRPPR